MLKALHVISDTNIGGAGRYLLTFLENFDRERLKVQVLCPHASKVAERCRGLGVEVFTSPYLDGDRSLAVGGLVRSLCYTRDLIREQGVDVVHTHASFTGRLAARMAGVSAIVYTKHRLDWETPGKGIKKRILGFINRNTCHRAIAVSQAVRETLIDEGMPRERIELIYNGIDVERFRREAAGSKTREQLGIGDNPMVGMVGRLEAEKGHRYFLEAAARVRKEYAEAVFIIVGEGALSDELKEMARRLGVDDQVVFTGFREDIPQLIAAMDVMVVPSLTEAFGFTLVEGMALGRPCVASAVGGMSEVAEDGRSALLVPPGDVDAIAEKVLYLLQNRTAASELGERAAREVECRFSARVMAERTTELYYRIMKEK